MSRCPSDTLDEEFVREMVLGELSDAEVAELLALWEPLRDDIERTLARFDADSMSWRDFRNGSFDWLPWPERMLAEAGVSHDRRLRDRGLIR